jgi:LysM repeat protein
VQQQLNAHANAVNQALQAQDAETKRRLTVMATETNKAIAALDKKVDAALGSRPVGNSTSAVASDDSTPPAIPSNMPQNGITYVVKSGDTISKIASTNSSRTDWILAANKLTAKSVRNLPIGTKLFIPQRNTAPQPPQQPANATN